MKIFKTIAGLSLISLSLISIGCQESLDEVNTNPNSPEIVPTYGILNSATKELMDATRNDFESGRMSLPWVQYSAQVQYTEEDRFQFRETSSVALYGNLFRVAKDFKDIIYINQERPIEAAANGNNQNQIAVARIMLAYTFSILADSFGPVPYYSFGNKDADFQALDLQNYPNPKYASQEKIYSDILNELKAASNQLVLTDNHLNGDAIYKGDMLKWKKFANSLRLRIANRLKGSIPSAEDHIMDAISSGVMTSNSDNAIQPYANDLLTPSPMFAAVFLNSRTDFKVASTMVSVLKGQKGKVTVVDPRLYKYAAPVYQVDSNDQFIKDADGNKITVKLLPNAGKFVYADNEFTQNSRRLDNYIGNPYGLNRQMAPTQANSGTSWFSNNILKADFGEVLMEYSEVEFLLSEVNGWDDTHYKKGVKASLDKWGVSPADANNYMTNLPAANKENVLSQKWIALFMQPQEAYAEWRRTGYPNFLIKPGDVNPLLVPLANGTSTYTFVALSPSGITLTEMPSRITYPVTMKQLNPTGYNSGVAALGAGGDKVNTKLIWDKN
ncbi:SusD/RagB family nutrient-binding outer membrane lipoprotein [Chryseobacterium cucumeris]|uniref:SusD/RagB family nutrient-binding outer membrane lipoprotein n=1 Tax=Chryseobacterium cucumeris TaxID=1813611 RepID=UPI003207E401